MTDRQRNLDYYQSREYRDKLENSADISAYYRLHDREVLEKLEYTGTEVFRNAKVADIGCGGGSFLDFLSGAADEIVAVEPSAAYREHLEAKGYHTYMYAEDAVKDYMGALDVVTSFDVIEHVDDPVTFMKEVHHLLKPGGKAIIGTPSDCPVMRALMGKEYEQKLLYSFQHPWILSEKGFALCCETAGFHKISIVQKQRYGLSNVLSWLKERQPGGHRRYEFISETLDNAYRTEIEEKGLADYLVAYLEKDEWRDYEIKQNHPWGYSIPAFMAGVYKSHPNNVIYLTEKYRMNAKDIANIIFMIDEETRQRYDYDNIEHLYIEYNTGKTEDEASIQALKQNMENQEILVVVPGHSITEYREKIDKYIQEKNPVIISVNFYSGYEDSYIFWGNKKRFHLEDERNKSYRSIICSNVHEQTQDMCVVNYYSLINKGYKYFDNSTIMLLNLLRKIKVKKIVLAGFDGFDENVKENFVDRYFHNDRYVGIFQEINRELGEMLKQYVSAVKNECEISFLTPSMFGKTVNSIIYGT